MEDGKPIEARIIDCGVSEGMISATRRGGRPDFYIQRFLVEVGDQIISITPSRMHGIVYVTRRDSLELSKNEKEIGHCFLDCRIVQDALKLLEAQEEIDQRLDELSQTIETVKTLNDYLS